MVCGTENLKKRRSSIHILLRKRESLATASGFIGSLSIRGLPPENSRNKIQRPGPLDLSQQAAFSLRDVCCLTSCFSRVFLSSLVFLQFVATFPPSLVFLASLPPSIVIAVFSSHHASCCLSSSVGPHPAHTVWLQTRAGLKGEPSCANKSQSPGNPKKGPGD